MRPFVYDRPGHVAGALAAAADASAHYLAGGTTILDLMKLDVMRPERLVDLRAIEPAFSQIGRQGGELYLGALATMSQAARHPDVARECPMIAQAIDSAASAQIRNMATLGGNVLQRTRCGYFRDTAWSACNKRMPGSGCAARDGNNRKHAVLGTSDQCIATYAGDFAQALVALDAQVEICGSGGSRIMRFEELHRVPGDTPHVETVLDANDLITGFRVPIAPWTRRSLFLKVRDRESYEFALAAAAVALDQEGGIVREVRIGLGGVATKPWRAREAEAALAGQPLNEASARRAAEAAFASATVHGQNNYKRELGERTLVRALMQASAMRI